MKGVFITFEGCESCGKSTQSRLLSGYLKEQGRRVVFLREPGGTRVSEAVRGLLLDPENRSIAAETELLLYMASRAQTVREVILPALKNGAVVVCDRFLDSTVVYQGYGLGMDTRFIAQLGRFATAGVTPDLTILLELPLKKAFAGISRKKDRIEQRSFAYHQRVKKGYLELARREPKRIKIVKLAKGIQTTQAAIRSLADAAIAGKTA